MAATPLPVKVAAAVAVAALLVGGIYVLETEVARTRAAAIVLAVAWFLIVSIAARLIVRARPDLRWALRGTVVLFGAAAILGFYFTSFRDKTVDEKVVVGTPATRSAGAPGPSARGQASRPTGNVQLAGGGVTSLAHSGSGRAAVVGLAGGGRRLTLTRFELDPGPSVKVYLVAGSVNGSDDVTSFKDLGELKGSRGNQQYVIPEGVDLKRYRTVVFWCVPFKQALAKAELTNA